METSRPHMPDYGVAAAADGLLPWEWAVERLAASRHYWVATAWPDGRPHVTPVWGVWLDGALWFSCGGTSRKARNLAADPRCAVTTADPAEPVIVEGVAESVLDQAARYADVSNAKYETDVEAAFYASHALFRVVPAKVIGLAESAFADSPTRWSPG